MSYYSDINYDDFFQTTTKLLQENLPAELRKFKTRRHSNDCWIVLTYPDFKYAQYELHLSSSSPSHAKYFGLGPHIVSAFYYKTILGDSDSWLEALASSVEYIQKQLSKPMVIGPWSKKWVWIAECLDGEPLTPENLSLLFAQFIQATYKPITLAFKAIGR